MGETEYIDIFSNNPKKDIGMDSGDGGLTEEFFNPGRSKINDYKRSSSTIHKSNGNPASEDFSSPMNNTGRPDKKYINLSDERVVWAGAIFVFFGVFVFLIGYWLGKTTVKEIGISSHQTIQKFEEKLDQKKMENSLAITPAPAEAPQADNSISPATAAAPAIEPATPAIEANPARVSAPSHKTTVAPPLQATHASKNVKLQTKNQAAKTASVAEPKAAKTAAVGTAAADGNFTIQISAHTDMEKARSVEDSIRKMGYQSYLVEASVNGVNYYRVRAGKFGGKSEAQAALEKIKASSIGKDSFILNLK